ncbi:MAG TPA: hypothetical protein ENH57_03580 [Actinobacteria bacterium]|nr:hypothetical protein [Actinomycetota bacterium]
MIWTTDEARKRNKKKRLLASAISTITVIALVVSLIFIPAFTPSSSGTPLYDEWKTYNDFNNNSEATGTTTQSQVVLNGSGSPTDPASGTIQIAPNTEPSGLQTLDSGTKLIYPDITVDSNGKKHIVATDLIADKIRYGNNTTGSWVFETFGVTDDTPTSIVTDSNNKAHLSIFNNGPDDLKYATNSSGSMVVTTIDTSGVVGVFNDIALDSSGKVHIAYSTGWASSNNTLKYATNTSGDWTTETIDTNDEGNGASIAIDSDDKVHISHVRGTSLYYTTNASGSWVSTSTGSGSGVQVKSTSIAIDSNSKMHISYSKSNKIYYANNISGSWSHTNLGGSIHATGSQSELALVSNNKVHVIINRDYENDV